MYTHNVYLLTKINMKRLSKKKKDRKKTVPFPKLLSSCNCAWLETKLNKTFIQHKNTG